MDTSGKLQAFIHKIKETSKKFQQQSTRDSLTGSDVSNCSDIDDNEEPLSHAEESAIEECLNDTEGSLSSVDLNIFDDVSDDLHANKTKKTRGQRMSERVHMDIGGNGIDRHSSLEEANSRKLQFLKEKTRKTRLLLQNSIKYLDLTSSKTDRRIVRRKRRNSPPIKKKDKTHIHSFFSSMADLVSTFPKDHVAKAKQNVNSIMEEMVDKLIEWFNQEDPTNPTYGSDYDLRDYRYNIYRLIQDKLPRLQDIH